MKPIIPFIGLVFLLGAANPPAAEIRPVTDTYFGIKIVDPYRYLENLADPATQTWMKAQSDYARSLLDHLADRAAIRGEIQKYVDAAPASITEVRRMGGGECFYLKTLSGQSLAKLYMRKSLDDKEILLVDTDRYIGSHGEPPAINYYEPSPDGKYIAYGVSQGGSEEATVHIVDTQTGKDLPETIDREQFGAIEWRADHQSFFYNRLQAMTPTTPAVEKYNNSKAYLHRLGDSSGQDAAVFGIGLSPRVEVSPLDDTWVQTQEGSTFALGIVDHGTKLEHTLYVAPAATIGQTDAPWVKVCDVDAQVIDFAIHGDDLYLLTHADAPNFKIVKISLSHPNIADAVVVVPPGPAVLRGLTAAADAIYVSMLEDGIQKVLRVPYSGAAKKLTLPFAGSAAVYQADVATAGVLLNLSGWTKGPRIVQYDPAADQLAPTNLQPAGPYDDLDDLVAEEVIVPSYDGAMVPLSIVHKKGLNFDGKNPTILDAYGGYGITLDPAFSPSFLAWMERGGIFAVAHVRGGGEKGEDWHKGAFKLTKPNVWRDVIACGQYLIDHKYTASSRLGIYGGSNGGITMGRAITERPDFFAAAAIRSGLMNALRFEQDPNGPNNVPEFGSASTQEGFEDLFAMDAYLHIRDGVAYPAVLLTTGINDPRVQPWSPAKMAARLQAATSSGKPVLLYVDYQGGHGIGMSKTQRIDMSADLFSFFLEEFGK